MDISVYKLKLVREGSGSIYSTKIMSPEELNNAVRAIFDLANEPEENMVMLSLNSKLVITGAFHVSKGDLTSTMATPREIYKRAILNNAKTICIAHNHPTGDVTPSQDDLNLTSRLIEAGSILGVALNDHLIVGGNDFYSINRCHPDLFNFAERRIASA